MIKVRLYDVQSSWQSPSFDNVNQNAHFVAVEQGKRKVEPANAEIDHRDTGRSGPASHTLSHFDAECVVTVENIADSRD